MKHGYPPKSIWCSKMEFQQPQGLIGVLLNKGTEYGDRSDAAMDLAAHDEPEAEEALLAVALDLETDPDLAETCGESLGEIWSRRSYLNVDSLHKLRSKALFIALGVIEARRPEWREYTQLIRAERL